MLLVPGLTATFLHPGAVKIKFQGSGKVTARPQGVNAKKTDCRHFFRVAAVYFMVETGSK